MQVNSKLNHSNYKKDFGVTITLMVLANAGERKVLDQREKT
jgi:hypothetical protein